MEFWCFRRNVRIPDVYSMNSQAITDPIQRVDSAWSQYNTRFLTPLSFSGHSSARVVPLPPGGTPSAVPWSLFAARASLAAESGSEERCVTGPLRSQLTLIQYELSDVKVFRLKTLIREQSFLEESEILSSLDSSQSEMGSERATFRFEPERCDGSFHLFLKVTQKFTISSKPHPDDPHLFDGWKGAAANRAKLERRESCGDTLQGGFDLRHLLLGDIPEELKSQMYPVGLYP